MAVAHLAVLTVFVDLSALNPLLPVTGGALLLALFLLPSSRVPSSEALAPLAETYPPPAGTAEARRPAEPTELHAGTWAELMARISHELRTPLNAIIGFSDLMGGELFGPMGHPRYREYVAHIRDSGRELLRSAEDTLAITALLARAQELPLRQTLELETVIGEAWQPLAGDAQARGLSVTVLGAEGLDVLGDRRGVRQIVSSLLAAAVERGRPGTEITILASSICGAVRLSIEAEGKPAVPSQRVSSLPACLARIMIELNGSTLVETIEPDGNWRAVTWLDRAAQAELFDR